MTIIERMRIQRMTVFDLPMSYVYGGVGVRLLPDVRPPGADVWRNARDGWRRPHDITEQIVAGLRAADMTILVFHLHRWCCSPACRCSSRSPARRCIYTHFIAGIPDFVILHRMAGGIDSFPLLAVPFFILAGNLMNSAGITNRIYDFAVALAGWMRGGLAHVNIIGSVIFAGMSGTAIADAAGLGTIEIKAMKDHGYSTEFSVGVTAASSTLGPIIPPSLPFVIYGMMAQCLDRRAVPRRRRSRRGDDHLHDGSTSTYCARRYNMGRDQAFRWRVLGADVHRRAAGAAHARDHHRRHDVRLVHADRSRDRGLRLGDDPRHLPLSLAVAEAVLQGHDGHHRDHRRRAADRRRGLAVRLGADDDARHRICGRSAAVLHQQPLRHPAADQRLLLLVVGCFLEPIASISILVPVLMPIILKVGIDRCISAW